MYEVKMEHFNRWNSPEYLWIFDFDLTLYGFDEIEVLQSMDFPMNAFIQSHLKMSEIEANVLRKKFWAKYGTTLAGLRSEFNVDPHNFFDFIHSHSNIVHPKPNKKLQEILSKIICEKWIFTNGRRDWAEIGTEKLGVQAFFTKLIDLEDSNWIGKPHDIAYEIVKRAMITSGRSEDQKVVFLDDNYENLITAKKHGWYTVWMKPLDEKPGPFDAHIHSLLELDRVFL